MSIERNRSPSPPQASSAPVVTDTTHEKVFEPSGDMVRMSLGLHTVPANTPEVDFITEKVLEMGGHEGPAAFTNLLLKLIRESEQSPMHSGDKMKDVFMLLKLRQSSGSVLSEWE